MFHKSDEGTGTGDEDESLNGEDFVHERKQVMESVQRPREVVIEHPGGDPELHALDKALLAQHYVADRNNIHEVLNLEYWVGPASVTVEASGGSAREEAVRACRIPRVCRLSNGTYLLPAFFKSQAQRLATCGITEALYVLPRGDLLPVKHAGFHLDSSTYRLDLIDAPPMQGLYRPLLILDLIPHLFSLESINRGKETNSSCTCFTGLDKCSGGCRNPRTYPAFVLDPSLWAITHDNRSWESHIMKEMALEPISASFFRSDLIVPHYLADHGAACFNSLITSPANYYDVPPGSLNTDYPFFGEDGGVAKRYSGSRRRSSTTCSVHVTIMQRSGERQLVGLFGLRDKLIKHFDDDRRVSVHIRIVHLQNMTYEDQVKVMLDTDILLAAHSSDISNVIFLPRTSSLVEVYPFSYHPSIFRWYAAILGLSYDGLMAEPDTETFKNCLKERDSESDQVQDLFAKWDEAASHFKKIKSKASLRLELSKSSPVTFAGSCARKQILRFDSSRAVNIILDRVADQCALQMSRKDDEVSSALKGRE